MFDNILQRLPHETVADKSEHRDEDAAISEASGEHADQQSNWHPTDLSPQVEPWLNQVAQLAESYHAQSITAALQSLRKHWYLPGFRLAFVGEFNRGKSTLINRLLNRSLVPIGALPTTANVISVIAGEQDTLVIQFHDGHEETRPLTASSWSDLIANSAPEKNEQIVPSVRMIVNHPWLQNLGIEMIDTPGAGDINDMRTAHIFEVLSQCDAAIVLISASIPLSLTERAFIEQEILGRHIPLVLVVVSKLDTIAVDQRSTVLAAIRERLNNISPDIPLLASYGTNSDTPDTDPLEEIRKHIAAMAAQSDRQAWRSRQIAGKLIDYLEQLVTSGQEALAQQAMDQTQRDKARKKLQVAFQSEASHWETIKLEFQQKRLQVEEELSQKLNKSGHHLVELFITDLAACADPRLWWEQQFPLLLHRELLVLARSSSEFLLDTLSQDIEYLQAEFAKTFDILFNKSASNTPSVDIAPQAGVPNIALVNTEQQLLLSRIGSSAAILIGYLLVGPIGRAISTAVGSASEHILKEAIEAQRQQVKEEVINLVDRTLEEYTRIFSLRLQALYEEVAQDIEQEQQTWLLARKEVLKLADEAPKGNVSWTKLLEDAKQIQEHIRKELVA